jgi:large subunit ribosomal protein L4
VGGTASSSERPAELVSAPAEAKTEAKGEKKTEKKAEPKIEKKSEVETTDDAKPELPKGAKAPLKSGGAPKGYEVKGNADSGLYHEPDGQWYEQTEAEFYFRSAEAAEAAGFTRAGEKKGDDQ